MPGARLRRARERHEIDVIATERAEKPLATTPLWQGPVILLTSCETGAEEMLTLFDPIVRTEEPGQAMLVLRPANAPPNALIFRAGD
jgi:hypothetical protein